MAFMHKTCKSSFIRSYRYDPERKILEVEFGPTNGKVESKHGYYEQVTPEAFDAFNHAGSHGVHLSKHIIPHHTYKVGRFE